MPLASQFEEILLLQFSEAWEVFEGGGGQKEDVMKIFSLFYGDKRTSI